MTASNGDHIRQLETAIRQTLESLNPRPVVILLGDVLHNFNCTWDSVLHLATSFVRTILELAPELYVLVGNHDRAKDTRLFAEKSLLDFLTLIPGVTLARETVRLSATSTRPGILLVPYTDPGRFMEALNFAGVDETTLSQYTLVCAHQEFRGVSLEGVRSTHGDLWPATYPLCVSGHIHKAQILAANLHYPGAPIAHTFGELDPKQIALYEFETTEAAETTWSFRGWTSIPLSIGQRMFDTCTAAELSTYKPLDHIEVRLDVIASKEEYSVLSRSAAVRELKARGVTLRRVAPEVIARSETQPVVVTNVQRSLEGELRTRLLTASPSVKALAQSILGISCPSRLRRRQV